MTKPKFTDPVAAKEVGSARPGTPSDRPPSSERMSVWILDDSPMEAAMARRALTPQYDVQTFVEGSTLIERLATDRAPSVLVLDWQLPRMSGIEVCRFLRTTRDEMELPILLLTVYGHKGDLVDGLRAGANDYLTKPYDAPELAARVATLARLNALHHKVRAAERRGAELLARERSARSDAEAANLAKDDFLAMVSHELRTPLNAILGWTRMIRTGQMPQPQIERALDTVERNALAQAKLIDDLMDMSRILAGKLTIEQQAVDFASLVQAAVDAVRPSAEHKGIGLYLAVDPEAGCVVGDASRLQQLIWNLLANAIKFTPKDGKVLITLECVDRRVELSVVDSGMGIAADFLPHVFERFRQGDVGMNRTKGGLGLGLAIVKHIVELHQGKVVAQSDGPGRGARFIVSLPRAEQGPEPDTSAIGRPKSVETARSSERLAGLCVLVVDDDEDARHLLGTMLRLHGAEIASASSVAMALEAIEGRVPDVVVSDIAMPDRDGYDLIRTLRALPTEARRVPVVALTAFARPDDRTRALSAGFSMYASKPVDPSELAVSIANLAGRVS